MADAKPQLKVAIVHDWLVGGGAEKVVQALHDVYPEAPIYTSYTTDEWRRRLDYKVITGPLQKLGRLRKFIPYLRIWWFTSLDFSSYDLVISSSGAEAKGIKTLDSTVHLNYCHAPTHYYWRRYDEYLEHPGFGALDPLARLGLRLLVGPLRRWDFTAAQRPNYMVANSSYTAEEIKKYYQREVEVIHPPVDTELFSKLPYGKREGFIITGRQTPYKHVELAVQACTELGLDLKVIGNGPDHAKLVAMAGPTIKFITGASSKDVAAHTASAKAFIFPAMDDFGISAVEALAAGTPVIAYKAGGALDYVSQGKTGLFFDEQTVDSLVNVLKTFDSYSFDAKTIKAEAQNFSTSNFIKNVTGFINNIVIK